MIPQNSPVDFSSAKILVIGDVMLDQYWYGKSTRLSPESPIPIVHFQHKEIKVGGAANVAANIQSLGAQVSLLGIAGKDNNGNSLLSLLKEQKINHHIVQHQDVTTITKTRVVANKQQIVRIDEEQSISPEYLKELYQRYQKMIVDYDVIVLSDYLKGTLFNPQELIKSANQANKIVLVDPKGTDYSIYKNAFCITPNSKELAMACRQVINSETDIMMHMETLANSLNLQALLLTRGPKGMTLWQRPQNNQSYPIINIPTQAKSVYDVSGAGDTVIATLACGLAKLTDTSSIEKRSHILQESVHYANQAAGISVAQIGSYSVSIGELNHLYIRQHAKYLSNTKNLKQVISRLKSQNKTIVFTNGCFDILHSGHVQCIEEAAKLGNQLIVALNSDASVKRLKGKNRPINTLMDRVDVLCALNSVDWVVDFGDNPKDNDTPINLIKIIQPDILVKGSDYNDNTIIGADHVKSYGGKVRTVELKKGYSSTQVINSLNN